MCLLVIAWRRHPRYRLILAGNRDEFHARPTAPATWWDDPPELLAGRDLLAQGTWLGAARDGRVAVVTNYRELGERRPDAPSRGALIVDYVRGGAGPAAYLGALAARAQEYAGFNLLAADAETLGYYSNRGPAPSRLSPGIYGLSNQLLDTPWPKLTRVRAAFEHLVNARRLEEEALLDLLADRTPADVAELPHTGLPLELERALSAPFIVTPTYGTRCSTLVMLDLAGGGAFYERRFDATGAVTGESRFEFDSNERPAS
jgi:uncharacterized protein with NRDE domain